MALLTIQRRYSSSPPFRRVGRHQQGVQVVVQELLWQKSDQNILHALGRARRVPSHAKAATRPGPRFGASWSPSKPRLGRRQAKFPSGALSSSTCWTCYEVSLSYVSLRCTALLLLPSCSDVLLTGCADSQMPRPAPRKRRMPKGHALQSRRYFVY